MTRRLRGAPAALALAAALVLAPGTARAESIAYQGVVGVGSALCSVVYSPLKVTWAVGGLVISGLALLWTWNTDAAGQIFTQTVGGDYVVTPSHLEGERDLRFTGD